MVRATPNGISAVIAADGALLGTVAHHAAGAVDVALPPARAATPFARLGNVAALLVGAAMIAAALVLRARRR